MARVATVEHDGACDLVLARSYYPGWRSRIDEGPEEPVLSADGGFQAVRINGSGTHRVALRYQPTGIVLLASISILSGSVALGVLAAAILSFVRRRCLQTGHGLSFSSSTRMVSMSEAISSSLKSNRMPAAANSSGSGREPPSARAFL